MRADLTRAKPATIRFRNFCVSVCYPKRNLRIKVSINIIFHVVLCRCETWSLMLREECIVRAYEDMMLRRILGQ